MTWRMLPGVALFTILLIAGIPQSAKQHTQTQQSSVAITDPARDGIEVRKGMTVKGTASIASGHHLWVLARRSDYEGVWWPQSEGRIDPSTRVWKASVTFGEAEDVGWDFEIGVIVVNEEGHLQLRDYRIKAMKDRVWNPIEVPPSAAAPQIRTVKKVAHN